MRIGLIGPAEGDLTRFRDAAEFLLERAKVDQAVYLGPDDAAERAVSSWAEELGPGGEPREAFLTRAAELAEHGTPQEIRDLLAKDASVRRLSNVRKLPPPPARAVEMIDDRIVMMVFDKSILDEDDIANATLIVFGKSADHVLRRFGPRCFFSPGPLVRGKVGVVERDPEGRLLVSLFDKAGNVVARELMTTRASKLTVSS